MPHAGEDLGGRGALDDAAGVHDEHTVGPFRDDPHVVGDEDDRHVEVPAESVEQVEDLGLNGDVEGRGGFVGDQELRGADQAHGDHHPLAQAARELVGVGIEPA